MPDAHGLTRARSGGVAMFKNSFQSGFLSILYSIGSKPLQIWDKEVRAAPRRHARNNIWRRSATGISSASQTTTSSRW